MSLSGPSGFAEAVAGGIIGFGGTPGPSKTGGALISLPGWTASEGVMDTSMPPDLMPLLARVNVRVKAWRQWLYRTMLALQMVLAPGCSAPQGEGHPEQTYCAYT